jgi:2-dehydropantoate 2-reductase
MKIAVVGCGALGSFYGAKFCRAGHDTHFLLRTDYEVVRRQGVQIQSIEGDFAARPVCACEPEQIGPCEAVLIGLKTTANGEFKRLLPPLVNSQTLIVTLQNGLGNEEQLEALFVSQNILCGLCFVCLNRIQPGLIRHSAHGRIVLGEYRRPPMDRTRQLAETFKMAGIPCSVAENLEQAHWEKLIWNIPFNGLGVAGVLGYEALMSGRLGPERPDSRSLPTDVLLGNPQWAALVRELMEEVIAIAQALGYPVSSKLADINIENTRQMASYKASTLIDFEQGRPLELESLFFDPLRRAQRAGVSVPRLTALCAALKKVELSCAIKR